MTTSLTIHGITDATVGVIPQVAEWRDRLLAELGEVTTIGDEFAASVAVDALKRADQLLKNIEADRVAVKAPVLELTRRIDGVAKDAVAGLAPAAARVSRLLGEYQVEQRRLAAEAEHRAREEARRIERDAAAAAAAAKPEQAAAIAAAASEQIVAVRTAAASAAAPKAAGTAVRVEVCYEVTDISALYAARPELVTLEPNGSAIRAIIKANPNLSLPGLRHWTEAKTTIR